MNFAYKNSSLLILQTSFVDRRCLVVNFVFDMLAPIAELTKMRLPATLLG